MPRYEVGKYLGNYIVLDTLGNILAGNSCLETLVNGLKILESKKEFKKGEFNLDPLYENSKVFLNKKEYERFWELYNFSE